MTSFRERNPVPIGAVGLLLIGLLTWAAFSAQHLPIIGGGTDYSAAFSEAGGISAGDDVTVAGVKVGRVTGIDLEDGHVRVDFTITSGAELGPKTGASIRLATVLGKKYLALAPAGRGRLQPGGQIPLTRTVSSYDVIDAFADLTTTTERIDTGRLADSLDVIATEFKDSPKDVKAAVDGLSRLSRTVASRDSELHDLLAAANRVTGLVAGRRDQLAGLIGDTDLLMAELAARRDDIRTVFRNTTALSDQLTGLVADNRAQLRPALEALHATLTLLQRYDTQLQETIRAMAPFTRVYANTLGTGRWFDTWVANLVVPVGTPGLKPAGPSAGGSR